jgi:hypothetical protein
MNYQRLLLHLTLNLKLLKSIMKSKVLSVLAIALIFVACEKDNASTPEPTPCPSVLTKKQILTQKTWQVDEVLRNISGTNTRFVKGGSNTTGTNYNLIKLTFKTDGTGTYTDEVGIVIQPRGNSLVLMKGMLSL